jgi:hypothetical protein
MNELTELEQKILLLLRQLAPYEVIEIKMLEDGRQVSVTIKSTVKEIFPA